MQENYLSKWLNDELTEAELVEFKKTEAYQTYEKIKQSATSLEGPEFDMDNAWEELKVKRTTETPKVFTLTPFKAFLRIAAVVAVLLTGAFLYLKFQQEHITTGYAENKAVTLPDTSELILNAESEVSFNKKNWEANRNIELEGEAYFKVAKGKKFTVQTELGEVTVLGTQFNVEARKGFFEVSCFEGLVSVQFKGKETKLPAGSAFLALNDKESLFETTKNGTPSWLNNESSFKSIPLHYVIDELKRQFNIEITSKNVDTNQLFTGSFSNEDLTLALKSISVPLNLDYDLDGNKVLFYEEKAP